MSVTYKGNSFKLTVDLSRESLTVERKKKSNSEYSSSYPSEIKEK